MMTPQEQRAIDILLEDKTDFKQICVEMVKAGNSKAFIEAHATIETVGNTETRMYRIIYEKLGIIAAIKEYRNNTHAGLADSKRAIDNMAEMGAWVKKETTYSE